MNTWSREEFFAELNRIGEKQVRIINVATGIYGNVNEKGAFSARLALGARPFARRGIGPRKRSASSLEQIRVARSAKKLRHGPRQLLQSSQRLVPLLPLFSASNEDRATTCWASSDAQAPWR